MKSAVTSSAIGGSFDPSAYAKDRQAKIKAAQQLRQERRVGDQLNDDHTFRPTIYSRKGSNVSAASSSSKSSAPLQRGTYDLDNQELMQGAYPAGSSQGANLNGTGDSLDHLTRAEKVKSSTNKSGSTAEARGGYNDRFTNRRRSSGGANGQAALGMDSLTLEVKRRPEVRGSIPSQRGVGAATEDSFWGSLRDEGQGKGKTGGARSKPEWNSDTHVLSDEEPFGDSAVAAALSRRRGSRGSLAESESVYKSQGSQGNGNGCWNHRHTREVKLHRQWGEGATAPASASAAYSRAEVQQNLSLLKNKMKSRGEGRRSQSAPRRNYGSEANEPPARLAATITYSGAEREERSASHQMPQMSNQHRYGGPGGKAKHESWLPNGGNDNEPDGPQQHGGASQSMRRDSHSNSHSNGLPNSQSNSQSRARRDNTSSRGSEGELQYDLAAAHGVPPEALDPSAAAAPRIQCSGCGRKFAEAAYERHAPICSKIKNKRRTSFESSAQRVSGTELEKYVRKKGGTERASSARKAKSVPLANEKGKKSSKWRQQSSAFREAMKQARMLSDAQAKGIDIKDMPMPAMTSGPDPDLVPCPHCGRTFNEQAAERHIPKCTSLKTKPKGKGLKAGDGRLLGKDARKTTTKLMQRGSRVSL